MSDTEIGYIDYSTLNVDKNATYDSLRDQGGVDYRCGTGHRSRLWALFFGPGRNPRHRRYQWRKRRKGETGD